MARNFSASINFQNKTLQAIFVPVTKPDGMHFEVNIKAYPRFSVGWSALGRYDIVGEEHLMPAIPYELILAVSEILENKITGHS